MVKPISNFGKYIMLMGRVFARPERFRMYFKQYVNEMAQLGINSNQAQYRKPLDATFRGRLYDP